MPCGGRRIETSPQPRKAGFPPCPNPRSTAVRQNLRGMRSLLRFKKSLKTCVFYVRSGKRLFFSEIVVIIPEQYGTGFLPAG